MLISSLYVAVNTSGVQNYLKQSVIDYINIDSNNYLQIGKSSFNLKGEVVLNVLKKIMKFENTKNKKETA